MWNDIRTLVVPSVESWRNGSFRIEDCLVNNKILGTQHRRANVVIVNRPF